MAKWDPADTVYAPVAAREPPMNQASLVEIRHVPGAGKNFSGKALHTIKKSRTKVKEVNENARVSLAGKK
jgi:hypothetical protein